MRLPVDGTELEPRRQHGELRGSFCAIKRAAIGLSWVGVGRGTLNPAQETALKKKVKQIVQAESQQLSRLEPGAYDFAVTFATAPLRSHISHSTSS